jgi:hypothetical protein
MSKLNIPVCNLNEEECNTLFESVVEKLNIQNPKFYYPIYNKIVDNASSQHGLVFDSKFKVKQILAKVMDSDSEEYETDDENINDQPVFNLEGGNSLSLEEDVDINDDHNLEEILNTQQDINLENSINKGHGDGIDIDDDLEIEEAISNIFTATALVERVNKTTGEKVIKEEKIHIKKSPLLEPLKILKDEFVIPARLQNRNLTDDTLRNTNSKIDSYNNSAHVEALFLYLGNKLVESGRCPSFPYYYGCINGEDPNYHHDITDEYDMVSRTRWFRNRIKSDFDLLILEGDELDEAQREMDANMRKPLSYTQYDRNGKHSLGSGNSSHDEEDSDQDGSESQGSESQEEIEEECDDIEQTLEFLDKNDTTNDSPITHNQSIQSIELLEPIPNRNIENEEDFEKEDITDDKQEKQNNTNIISIDQIDSTLENILADMNMELDNNRKYNQQYNGKVDEKDGFIQNMDDEDLDIHNNLEYLGEEYTVNNQNKNGGGEQIGEVITTLDNDLIEVLSDVDKENLTMSDFEDNSANNQYYLKCAQIPVNLCLMEKLDQTLDNLLDDGYTMSENEWFSIFFQTAFGLAIAQKYFNFVHNDLHSSNIMFKSTELKFLYFQIGYQVYKVPTFGKITKIIDFARGTFKLGDRWVFSDQFKEDGDAWGQYDYPTDGTLKNCEHKPNPSFDLVRLATTVIQRLDDVPNIRHFVEDITKDDYDNSLCYEEDTFQLYIDIAHNAHNAVPINVLSRPEFERFKVSRERVPKGIYVFKY